MMNIVRFLKDRAKSFIYAFQGIRDILRTEHNARVHAFFTFLALFLSKWLHIPATEFVMIVIVIALVWITEAFNTVFEVIVDMVSPNYSDLARRAKDLSAAAVLVAAIAAFVVGMTVLFPPLLLRLGWV